MISSQNLQIERMDSILDSFSDHLNSDTQISFLESKCFLKTRTDKFKEHWALLQGKDLLCYRRKNDTDVRVMHCLTGTYLQQMKSEINPDTE